mgnify:CR=1 FL=1
MNIEEIVKSLQNVFKEHLKDGQVRKIVFWLDRDKKFVNTIDEIELEGVKKHKLENNNYFYTKYLLEEEDTYSDFLIYTNEDLKEDIDNWLIDCLLYSKRFFADNISLIMRDMGIDPSLRAVVKENDKFFDNKERYKKFKSFAIENYNEEVIEIAIISALCGLKSPDFEESLRVILIEGLNDEENKYLDRIDSFFSLNRFWGYVEKNYGYKLEEKALGKLMMHLMITALSHTLEENALENVNMYIGKASRSNCLIFIDRWMNHVKDSASFDEYALMTEKEIGIEFICSKVEITDMLEINVFPYVDRAIIIYITNAIEHKLEDYEFYIKIIDARKNKHFYSKYEAIYEALYFTVRMFEFKKVYNMGIPMTGAEEIYKAYCNEYYKMDLYYRKFYVAYDSDNDSEILKKLKNFVENIYTNWFVSELSYAWSKSIDDMDFEEVQIQSVIKQRSFYDQMIRHKVNSGDRVFVIVSDALRYEVATEVLDRLNTETMGSAQITSMTGVLPSISKFGMPALLPGNSMELKDSGLVYVDGINSSSLEGRNKILNEYVSDSVALDAKELFAMNKQKRRDFFKGKRLIYIYHNSIDAFGDKYATEIYAFRGTQEAINDICDLIRIIKDDLSGTNIYVTADHGFIYQRDALEESDKIEKEKIDFIESGRRYALSTKKRRVDGLLGFSMKPLLGNDSNVSVYIPKANIRFKIQGPGSNFVHGGASLQEIVLPLISYKNIRRGQVGSKDIEKVKIKLTNAIRKITNSIFTLNFFQSEKVEGKRVEASFKVYMVDEADQMISNEETIIANKKTDTPESRNISVKFVLKSMDYDKNKDYYLIINDADTGITKEKIPFKISLGIVSDFDF